jgi:hypothetical protein
MSKSLLNLGNNAIMFGDPSCPACLAQYKLLSDKFSKRKDSYINYYDLSKKKVPAFLTDSKGDYSMPTWYIPSGNNNGKLYTGIISTQDKLNKLLSKRTNNFGNVIPDIGTLAKYGKTFSDGKGFNIQNSFAEEIQKKWGNSLNSGTLGREFGPGGTDKIYSNGYYNNIRMGVPGGDLDTALSLNSKCNIENNSKAKNMTPGMIYDSENPQIVGFGKKSLSRRVKFGNLYQQMGPSYTFPKINSDYTGGLQNNQVKPGKISSKTFIGQAPDYMPNVRSANSFGKKKLIGPGTILSIKNRKIKIKN